MTTRKVITIDDALWKAAKKEAKKQGSLFSAFISRAIKDALDSVSAKAKAAGK